MRSHIFTAFTLLSTLSLTACGEPCGVPAVRPDGVVLAAEACDEPSTSHGSTSTGAEFDTASETTTPSSGGDSSSTGDDTTAGPVMPTCSGIPEAGEAWGPCFIGPDPCGPGLDCKAEGIGNICVPSCEDSPCALDKCFNGTCGAEDVCVWPCDSEDDCLLQGTVCDLTLPAPICVYTALAPKPAPFHEPPAEAGWCFISAFPWGPCGAGDSCTDGTFCAAGQGGKLCAPEAVKGGCSETAEMCGEPAVSTSTGLCVPPCSGTTDCHGGMICDVLPGLPQSGACTWPSQPAPSCDTTPDPGEFGGPCMIDGNDPFVPPACTEGACTVTALGNLCTPSCLDGACGSTADCIPGMICDIVIDSPICVWPAFAALP